MPVSLLPERSYRWNFIVMGFDISLFTLALTFASAYGVLPLFAHHLTTSNVALGLIPAVRGLGALLPPILVAAAIQRLPRRKPFVLYCTVFERVPYLILAVLTPLLARDHPTILLWLFFAMLAASTCAGGVATPAWLDLVARVLPDDWRGRFFGLWSALGSLLGLVGGALTAELLRLRDWPHAFALCFGCAFGCLVVSFVFLLTAREGLSTAAAPPATRGIPWRRYAALLREDRNFGIYLVANALVTLSGAATAFYAVDAKRTLLLSDAGAGLYGVALLAASLAGNLLWGYVGDHMGHKRVLEAGALCTGLAAGMAVASHAVGFGIVSYGVTFALVGLGSSAVQMTALTFVLDLAPFEHRAVYIGIASLAQVPFACAAPLLGGIVADQIGYGAIFVASLLLGLASAAIVLTRVHDPRRPALQGP